MGIMLVLSAVCFLSITSVPMIRGLFVLIHREACQLKHLCSNLNPWTCYWLAMPSNLIWSYRCDNHTTAVFGNLDVISPRIQCSKGLTLWGSKWTLYTRRRFLIQRYLTDLPKLLLIFLQFLMYMSVRRTVWKRYVRIEFQWTWDSADWYWDFLCGEMREVTQYR